MKTIAIVGAGLVGTVLSVYLARMGYEVSLYDYRQEPRRATPRSGVSINLSLSKRGLDALDRIGVGQAVRQQAVRGYGRLIHPLIGEPVFQPYGSSDESLYSISRCSLHTILTDFAQREPSIQFHYQEKCVDVDLEHARLCLQNTQAEEKIYQRTFDHIVGADGVHSIVRQKFQRQLRFQYAQRYLDHGYREFVVPLASLGDGSWQEDVVHVWPRGDFMLMGLPNCDGTVSLTLTMPFEGENSFATRTTQADYADLFATYFPEAAAAVQSNLVASLAFPVGSQIEIKCFPWIYQDKAALIGDACHAIFNFFAQGVNAGFEDCRIFAETLVNTQHDWGRALANYQTQRKANTDAIADLSARHFELLRKRAVEPDYQRRYWLEQKLSTLFPERSTLYRNIAFTTLPYGIVQRLEQENQQLIDHLLQMDLLPENLDEPKAEQILHGFVKKLREEHPADGQHLHQNRFTPSINGRLEIPELFRQPLPTQA